MYCKNVCRRIVLAGVLVFSQKALAASQLGLDYGTLRFSNSGETLSSVERSTLDGYVSVGINRGRTVHVYLGYLQADHVERFTDGTYESTVSTHPYLGFGYLLKDNDLPIGMSFSLLYSPVARLTLSQPTGTETWEGESFMGKIGLNVKLSRRIKLATSLVYVSETFNKKISGELTERSAFEQNYFAPSIGLAADY